jgi:hypothetical protein
MTLPYDPSVRRRHVVLHAIRDRGTPPLSLANLSATHEVRSGMNECCVTNGECARALDSQYSCFLCGRQRKVSAAPHRGNTEKLSLRQITCPVRVCSRFCTSMEKSCYFFGQPLVYFRPTMICRLFHRFRPHRRSAIA